MKKWTVLLLSISCALMLAACGAASNGAEDAKSPSVVIQDGVESPDAWGISLTVEKVTSKGATLICTQKNGRAEGTLETGSAYWIEKKEEDRWVTVQPQAEPVWDMMAYLIPSGETIQWELDWTWLYGELGAGTYRICKTVVDFKESGSSESRNYCAEFTIK